jgi:hypothetical protein
MSGGHALQLEVATAAELATNMKFACHYVAADISQLGT